jgi:anthraniloyl-CoA monooxygenase
MGAEMSRLFCTAGTDVIDCSSGHVSKAEKLVYGRGFQVLFSDCIRRGIGISTIAVGSIFEGDHVNTIIAAGRPDLCDIALLRVPATAWTQHEAPKQGYPDAWWPKQHLSGKLQLQRNHARAHFPLHS